MKLSKIILAEEAKAMLSSLTYDQIAKVLGSDRFNVPNTDDSSTTIFSDRDWQRWKEFTMKRWGDIEIALDPMAPYWGKVKILDPAYNKRKDDYSSAKGAWLDKERQAGRTSGLD